MDKLNNMSEVKKFIVAGMVGLALWGASWGIIKSTEPKLLKLQGRVKSLYNTEIRRNIFGVNQYRARIAVNLDEDRSARLDPTFHDFGKVYNYATFELYVGSEMPNINEGDKVYFNLTDGFAPTGKTNDLGDMYWINTSPVKGILTGIEKKAEGK